MFDEHLWLVIGVLVTTPAALGFTVAYGLLAPWYKSATGRAMMILATGCASLVLAGMFRLFVGHDSPIFIGLRLLIYTFLPIGLWYMLFSFLAVLCSAHEGEMVSSTRGSEGEGIEPETDDQPL